MSITAKSITFNSPLEAGLRSLIVLVAGFPKKFDIQQLVVFDHLIVHTGDIGGPKSLHPDLPYRSTELLVRRQLVENGILLMMSRRLIERVIEINGITYRAGEFAENFLSSLTAPYFNGLKNRAEWVVNTFSNSDEVSLKHTLNQFFDQWIEEFQVCQRSLGEE